MLGYCRKGFFHLLIFFPCLFQFDAVAFEQNPLQFCDVKFHVGRFDAICKAGIELIRFEHQSILVYHVQKVFPGIGSPSPPILEDAQQASQNSPDNQVKSAPFRILAHKSFWFMAFPIWYFCYFIGRRIGGMISKRKIERWEKQVNTTDCDS